MTDHITTPRALLEQALEALTCNLHPTWIGLPQTVEAIRAELAKPTPSPAWHDAPTCAGLWVVKTLTGPEAHNIDPHDVNEVQIGEWYGPIPQDGGKS